MVKPLSEKQTEQGVEGAEWQAPVTTARSEASVERKTLRVDFGSKNYKNNTMSISAVRQGMHNANKGVLCRQSAEKYHQQATSSTQFYASV